MTSLQPIRLGVNIDHVATLRNARGGHHPDPARAAEIVASAGADGITAHLREDRRHIRDADMRALKDATDLPLNFEMAATAEMLKMCLDVAPHACCIVPENRNERTTEGGLDVAGQHNFITPFVRELTEAGVRASLFIDPVIAQIDAALRTDAPVIEIHTGAYHEAVESSDPARIKAELAAIREAAAYAHQAGLEVHAGHGLTFLNVQPVAAIPEIRELNIGHFLIAESVFMGLAAVVKEMRQLIDDARTGALY